MEQWVELMALCILELEREGRAPIGGLGGAPRNQEARLTN